MAYWDKSPVFSHDVFLIYSSYHDLCWFWHALSGGKKRPSECQRRVHSSGEDEAYLAAHSESMYPLVNKHSYWKWPSRNSGFTYSKWWFSIVMLVYQRVIWSIAADSDTKLGEDDTIHRGNLRPKFPKVPNCPSPSDDQVWMKPPPPLSRNHRCSVGPKKVSHFGESR